MESNILYELSSDELCNLDGGSFWDYVAAVAYTVGYVVAVGAAVTVGTSVATPVGGAVAGGAVAKWGQSELEEVWTEAILDN